MSFIDDIQGQNTQLYPIITIEPPDTAEGGNNWKIDLARCKFFSTNNVSLDHIHSEYDANVPEYKGLHFQPLLLNIPSIKESIDIESRKFKISNVSLDLSNIEYEGKRFTDILSDTSLMNWKCSIQFVSPSANKFSTIFGLSDAYTWDNESMYQAWSGTGSYNFTFEGLETDTNDNVVYHSKMTQMVYQGIIRRISHDDTKCKIELEDLTEKLAHKDLPQQTPPASDYLPDKYVNKPIPMVYGHVDRSPLLPYYSYSEDVGDDSDEVENILEYRLKIDSRQYSDIIEETVDIGNSEFTKSGLFIKEGDAYLNLHKTNAELGSPTGVDNFRYEGTSIVLDTDDVAYSEGDSEISSNDFSKGRLRVHQIRRFNKVVWEESGLEAQTSSYGGLIQGELQVDTGIGIGRITGTIDTDTYQSGAGWSTSADDTATRDWNAGYFKCILEPITIPNSMAKNEDGNIIAPTTRVLANVVHYNFNNGIPTGGVQNTTSGHPNYNDSFLYTKWGVWVGSGWASNTESGEQSANEYYINSSSVNNITGDGTLNEILLSFPSLTSFDNIKIGIPKHNFKATTLGSGIGTTFDDDDDVVFGVDTTITDAFVVQTFFLDGITDKDYFANVKGRINTFDDHPDHDGIEQYDDDLIMNPIDIIYDLVRSELGHDAIDEDEYWEAKLAHLGWKFGFTVNKKINSKKLIEDIAKSTKCFPKFKNDGTFGFNTIKDSYTVDGDYNTATEIKESEVISYSFKKTKPEQIYKKITVSYNKDYAQDSYLKTAYSQDLGADPYYGIEKSTDAHLEFESDYIRHDNTPDAEQTADNLASFLSSQYKNDHLIFNLKLPLQYINLEIGDLVKFRDLFNGVKAYGIDYRRVGNLNNQWLLPLFMVTSTTRNLDSISIECMQLHHLLLNSDLDGFLEGYQAGAYNVGFFDWVEGGTFDFPDAAPVIAPPLPDFVGYSDAGDDFVQDPQYSQGYSGADIEIRGTIVKSSYGGKPHIYVDDVNDFDYGDIVPYKYYLISGINNLATENLTLGATNIVRVTHSYNPSYQIGAGDWLSDGENRFVINGAKELDYDDDGIADVVSTQGDNWNDWDIVDFQDVTIILSQYTPPVSDYATGDVNGDDMVNLLDVVQMVNYTLGNLEFNQSQINSGDMNQDTGVTILDVIQVVNLIRLQGNMP